MMFNPDYVPSGPNTPSNEYYKKINHVRIAKADSNKERLLGTVGGAASVFGPFEEGGLRYWLRGTRADPQIGFNVDADPEPDIWVSARNRPPDISVDVWQLVKNRISKRLP